tara:strand:+ start:1171 stop:1335 length:165 start_codon:yes stop_codon:yes gene_type:complete
MMTPISSEHLKGAEEQRAAWRGAVRITLMGNLKTRLYASPYFLEDLGSTVLDGS